MKSVGQGIEAKQPTPERPQRRPTNRGYFVPSMPVIMKSPAHIYYNVVESHWK